MQTCETIIGKILFALLLSSNVIFIAAEENPFVKYSDYEVLELVEDTLPRNAEPQVYNMNLTLNRTPDGLSIKGQSIISFRIYIPINFLRFHYFGNITKASLQLFGNKADSERNIVSNISCIDEIAHTIDLSLEKMLEPGFYSLYLKFKSSLPEEISRFEVSSFIDEDHGTDWFMTTAFPPIGARFVFPCWDVFGIATFFNICVQFNRNYTVYSNTGILRIVARNENSLTCFQPTNGMFVHHLAIAIIPKDISFHIISDVGDLRHRRVVKQQLKYMRRIIKSVIRIYSSYTNLNNLKTDFIIIPNIPKESIENWGLIVYREAAVIYDKDIDPITHKIEIKRLIARTFANAWLSYAIKPSWWSQLWLHEGFSTYFVTKIMSKQLFIVQTRHESLHMDIEWNMMALESTSLKNVFFSPFPLYVKAPVILYMLENIVTYDVFRVGIIRYLSEYYLRVATPDHLWSQMQIALQDSEYENTNIILKTVMDSWTKQQNYPIVTVERNNNAEINICLYYVKSKSFSLQRSWWIPITFTIQNKFDFHNTVPYAWLTPEKSCIPLEPIRKNNWIIVNLQQTGYYRVKYEQWNWQLLAKYLNSKKYENIHVLNRAQIIDDAYYFMMTEELDCDMFFFITKYLSQELNFKAWYPMLKIFEYISPYLSFPESASLQNHMLAIINSVLERITYEESDSDDIYTIFLRQELAKWACILDDFDCKKIANIKLVEYLTDSNSIIPGWKEWIYCNGLKTASRITWLKFFNIHAQSLKSVDNVLRILSCSGGVTSSNFQYNMQLSNNLTTREECINILYYVVATYEQNGLDTTLANLKDHILYCTFTPHDMIKVLTVIINRSYLEFQFSKVKEFVKNNINAISATIQHAIKVRQNYVKHYRTTFLVLSKGHI